ncbi:MAG: glycine cleavage system aminomethyltransferase GcvT [Calditrichaceae bacterium]|nr:glycine cleavage system aminomethyltransferase GcvT [Calditrichaceae bacterium]
MASKQTALYDEHVKLGARMVEFAGYEMPIKYHGIRDEHKRVRETVGIFDVSHMGEIEISGPGALDMVQKITINDAARLVEGQAQYSAMCYPDGGIVDDLLVYHMQDKYMLVVNASNKEKDLAWILENKLENCEVTDVSDQVSQLAVQGKKAEVTLQKLTELNLNMIPNFSFTQGSIANVPVLISRTGYTGEPGFELYFENQYAVQLWNAILAAGKDFDIEPVGLGARDSLRLEKKMYLYGNDIDQTTNPLEAGLGWITQLQKNDFIGREAILKIKEAGLKRKLIAFILDNPGFPRKGYNVFKNGIEIGYVTSGTVSPMLEKGIGLAYVAIDFAKVGAQIDIDIRGKKNSAQIIKPPFV